LAGQRFVSATSSFPYPKSLQNFLIFLLTAEKLQQTTDPIFCQH